MRLGLRKAQRLLQRRLKALPDTAAAAAAPDAAASGAEQQGRDPRDDR